YQDYGSSTTAASNRIQTVVNTMNLQYEGEVAITHAITTTLVRTSSNQPYTSADASTLLTQFRSEWNANQGSIQRDVAQLFTGKSIIGGTIGIAWVGAVCSSFAYGMVESDFNGSFASATDLSAHELGHNWNASHCSCTSYTMNPFITSSNTFNPQGTRPTITAFRDSRSCLSTGGGGGNNPPGSTGSPSPSSGANSVPTSADLAWGAATGATSYDVYFGTDSTPDPGEFLGNQSGTSRALGTLSFATTYYWRVDGVNSNGTTTGSVWSFTTESQPPGGPSNDSCGAAATLPLGNTTFDTTNATLSPGSWTCAGGGGPDIWYRYVAGSTADLRVETCGSGYDTALEVFTGTCSNLSLLACNDDSCGLQSQIDITGVSIGTTLLFRVGGYNGSTGTGTVTLTETSNPPPGVAGSPTPSNGASGVAADQDLSWSAGSGATSYDVYLGTNPALGLFSGDFQGNQTGLSRDVGTLQFDTTYYWRIDSLNGAGTTTGDVWSFTTESSPISNDDCSGAEIIGVGSYGFDTNGATLGGSAWTCAGGGGPDLWFSYTATSAADLRFETCGSGYDTALEVFIGSCSSPTLVSCNDDACGLQSQIDITGASTGTTLLVRVGGYNGDTGSGTLTVTETSPPPPGSTSNPLPVDGATGVPIDQDLSWTAASGAASYDVYLGTDPALGLFSGDFLGNQTGVSRDVGTLLYSTTYYWRVDALNSGGTTLGTVWSFTTEGPPPPTETLLFLDGFGQGSLGPGWSSPDLRKIRIRGGNPIDGFFARIRRAQYMEVTVDASAYTGLRLESSRRARNYDAGESFQVIVNGTAVETMTGSTGWITSDIDLTTFAGQSTVTVRFKSNGSRLNESGDIDQIRIIGLN
ncbi:MAG: M12 family metallo-peptidase, partial [Planctomycetota bacterium]|nr:M12 family metallo-peptidase [Planctomycetota bacterium]